MKNQREFTVRIQWLDDPDADLSYLGEFSDRESTGAVEYSTNPRLYRYFIPAISEHEHFKGLRETINPANPAKRVYGVRTARKLAKQYVQEDMQRAASYGDSWHMTGCVVTIRYNGRVIGMASLWSIESDSDRAYKQEIQNDLLVEARADTISFFEGLERGFLRLPNNANLQHDSYSQPE